MNNKKAFALTSGQKVIWNRFLPYWQCDRAKMECGIMKRNIKYIMLIFSMIMLMICGCSKEKETEVVKSYQVTEEDLNYALPKIGEAEIMTMKIEEGANGTITVATVGSPNTEILQEAGQILGKKGYLLKIEVCEDYLTPNQLVSEGKADCNYYQHEAFLERYNMEKEASLMELAKIHYEPLAIFSEKIESIHDVPEGAKVLVPQNPTALAQALFLLQSEGLLTLMEDADLTAMTDDIIDNPLKLDIISIAEEEMLQKLNQSDLAVCHKSYALKEGREAKEILLAEESKDSLAAESLSQGIVVSDINNENADILTETLMSKEMQQFIRTRYQDTIYMMDGKNEAVTK